MGSATQTRESPRGALVWSRRRAECNLFYPPHSRGVGLSGDRIESRSGDLDVTCAKLRLPEEEGFGEVGPGFDPPLLTVTPPLSLTPPFLRCPSPLSPPHARLRGDRIRRSSRTFSCNLSGRWTPLERRHCQKVE
jgi:hypothetical protein